MSRVDSALLHSPLAADPVLREMVQLFVDEMPGRTARMRAHFEARNWDALKRDAHQMKGSAGSHGFDQLTPLSAELEALLVRRAPIGEILDSLEALLAGCGRITAAAAS